MMKVAAWAGDLYRRLSNATIATGGRQQTWLRAGQQAVADMLFPPQCFLCGAETATGDEHFCQQCYQGLIESPVTCCPRCAKPVPRHTQAGASGCLLCRHKNLRFTRTVALGIYGGVLRDLVLRMKQARHEALSLATGKLLATRIAQSLDSLTVDIVVPVPMHWARRLGRGVNDAELLAESVANQLAKPLQCRMLRSRRRTRKQGTLLPAQRRANVRGAYRVARHSELAGAHVLVVDDVMTTGATANEIARMLRKCGAREISVAVVARGVGFD